MGDDPIDELLILLVAPVMALLDVEVLEIEAAVWKADVVLAQAFAHVDDVPHLFLFELIVD